MTFQPIIFGEVLFDVFDNEQAVLGGAPFNVAWHLHGFGNSPLFISRIGRDDYGAQIQSAMQAWGMNMHGVQIDAQHPTGQVQVSFQGGQPDFDILADVAYDHIDEQAALDAMAANQAALFYHGSLVARTDYSNELVKSLRGHAGTIFADINLRSPWWSQSQVEALIHDVDILKVNDDELAILMGTEPGLDQLENAARLMLKNYRLKKIVVTRGERGAFSISDNGLTHAAPVAVTNLVDTVGAGDSFSAICIMGYIAGWDEQTTLDRATVFAAQICQQRGATSDEPAMYQRFKDNWQI